jgi:hypothetical protein
MKRGLAISGAILGLLLCGLFLAGCGESRQSYAGSYRSVEPYAGKGHVDLELKDNGEATWSLAKEGIAIKLKWRVESDHIWLYNKEGGILHAIPAEGGKKLMVDLTGQWNPSCPIEHCLLFERVKAGGS